MNRSIKCGHWYDIETQQQFDGILDGARVQYGEFFGAGKYYLLEYTQKCPRGCCYDYVKELLTDHEAKEELKEEIRELEDRLDALVD